MARCLHVPDALRSVESQCHPEYLAVPATGLLPWLMLLWLVQRQPHTSLDPFKILPQQLWLGGRVLTTRVKSDPSFFTALAFAWCFLHNSWEVKGWQQDGSGKAQWKCLHFPTRYSSFAYSNCVATSKGITSYSFLENLHSRSCNLKMYSCRIQEIKLIFSLYNSLFYSVVSLACTYKSWHPSSLKFHLQKWLF